MKNIKERRGFGGETIMVKMINLSALTMCKPAQATTVDVSETGFLNPASLTSQTGLESLGRNKHCCSSHWPGQSVQHR
jgi:hypothetical protein